MASASCPCICARPARAQCALARRGCASLCRWRCGVGEVLRRVGHGACALQLCIFFLTCTGSSHVHTHRWGGAPAVERAVGVRSCAPNANTPHRHAECRRPDAASLRPCALPCACGAVLQARATTGQAAGETNSRSPFKHSKTNSGSAVSYAA